MSKEFTEKVKEVLKSDDAKKVGAGIAIGAVVAVAVMGINKWLKGRKHEDEENQEN